MATPAFVLDPSSVDETVDYLAQARERILAAIRTGMQQAMEGLAAEAVVKMGEAGIQVRTGDLLGKIENSPVVTEADGYIRGRVGTEDSTSGASRKQKHIGLWLEEGYHVPAVKLAAMQANVKNHRGKVFMFTASDGSTVFSRGHRAFDVRPHPFLNPALREYTPTIVETIQNAIEEALPE